MRTPAMPPRATTPTSSLRKSLQENTGRRRSAQLDPAVDVTAVLGDARGEGVATSRHHVQHLTGHGNRLEILAPPDGDEDRPAQHQRGLGAVDVEGALGELDEAAGDAPPGERFRGD